MAVDVEIAVIVKVCFEVTAVGTSSLVPQRDLSYSTVQRVTSLQRGSAP
jgi:hypothetical protein